MKLFALVCLTLLLSACASTSEPIMSTSGEFLTFEVVPHDTFQTYEITSAGPHLFDRWKEQTAMKIEQDKWESWMRGEDDAESLVGERPTEGAATLSD